jgi:hypothetical protein
MANIEEAEGCCIERARESNYVHNQMSKQVTKSHVRDVVHSVPCELRC